MSEPILTKVCSTCKIAKSVSEFHHTHRSPDGVIAKCKACVKAKNASPEHQEWASERYRRLSATPKGAAQSAWGNLTGRIRRAKAGVKRLRAYLGVEVRVTKEQFIQWAMPLFEAWFRDHPDETPSIDRISSEGHYEFDNMQMIPLPENSHKARRNKHLETPAGMKLCGRCKKLLPFASFKSVKPGATGTFGLYGWCIECTREYDRIRGKKKRNK